MPQGVELDEGVWSDQDTEGLMKSELVKTQRKSTSQCQWTRASQDTEEEEVQFSGPVKLTCSWPRKSAEFHSQWIKATQGTEKMLCVSLNVLNMIKEEEDILFQLDNL